MIPSKITRAFPVQGGFALVVTLSLMILLTIVAVGLLTLASVSLRSSSQGLAASTARANARLALMMAIGELQKEMGPDSRISAPHDAGNTAAGGQPHWTAVYDAWERETNASTAETPQSRSPKFRGWLASGANAATGGPAGTTDKVLLLGANSLGGTAAADDEIRVPMHEVSSGQQRGRLAWWTADEAAKAKVNAGPDATTTLASAAPNPLFGSQSPAHIGHRAIPKLGQFDWKDGQRAKTISTAQINLAAGLVGQAGLGNISHDLTVSSAGVLVDVRQGRLKRDLSNLLSRDVKEIENKPLYLANGRMNRFAITKDGALSNASDLPGDSASNRWGINLEELYLFHNIHREIDWSGGKPSLVMKTTSEEIFKDRYHIYRQPMFDAVQFILSLRAVPDKPVAGEPRYKMEPMLDGMVALSNPNDIPLVWPSGLTLYVQLNRIPYIMKWKNQNKDGMVYPTNKESTPPFFSTFRGFVGGGIKAPAGGFTLEHGESAAFGSSTATGQDMDIMRGFVPSGGVKFSSWNLLATGLKADDQIDFDLVFNETGDMNAIFANYGAWIRKTGNAQWQPEADTLTGVDRSLPLVQKLLPSPIRPPQVLPVSAFLPDPTDPQRKPKPIMMLNFLRNVEQSSPSPQNDAFPSRPFQLNEPAGHHHRVVPNQNEESRRHFNQTLITTEAMNYQFRTLAAGAGGRNVYHGGGRQPGLLGGSFNVIKRRLPLAPPLSLGAFENAIATGFTMRFSSIRNEPSGSAGPTAVGLTGFGLHEDGTRIAKAIGNSWSLPFMASDEVNVGRVTDHSWFVNTALWDQWFLSGIVDGRGAGSSPWMNDSRSPRAQFRDLAEGTGSLRNKRYLFYRHKPPEQALDDLFDGENFKPAALNKLANYLLIDGAFNVNSTSVEAWKALLTSVRKQKLLTGAGALQDADHPFGTLGYAVKPANTGTSEGDWNGFLDLTDTQMDDLAAAVVEEIKSRGPFLSLADFVNRRPDSSDADHRALGALQAAIDKSGINNRFTASGRNLTSDDFNPLDGKDTVGAEPNPACAVGAAGYLSQAALLTTIGSQIAVRGDTFTIRTYGDYRNASGAIQAKAWCEAVVQRVPEYVDPVDSPEAQDGWPGPSDKLAAVNSTFGRKFKIIVFRWLSPAEI